MLINVQCELDDVSMLTITVVIFVTKFHTFPRLPNWNVLEKTDDINKRLAQHFQMRVKQQRCNLDAYLFLNRIKTSREPNVAKANIQLYLLIDI